MTIVNDDSRIVNKLEASLTGDARVITYDRLMFMVLATGMPRWSHTRSPMTQILT